MDAPIVNAPVSYRWYEVWQKIYFHPAVESFREILADPAATMRRAYIWVAVVAAISAVAQGLTNLATGKGVDLLCGVIVAPIAAVISLAISTWLMHLIAGWFGGTGTFERLGHSLGAVQAPASLVSAVLAMLGLVTGEFSALATRTAPAANPAGCILAPLLLVWAIYLIVLEVKAIQAVESLTSGKALLVILIPGILVIVLGVVCVTVGLLPVVMKQFS